MADVFRTTQTHAGSFGVENSKVSFGGDVAGHIAQAIQFNYQQPINMIYELGSRNVYFVAGHAAGQASLNRVIGPAFAADSLISKYNDICNPQDIIISATPSFCGRQTTSVRTLQYELQDVVLTSIGGSLSAADLMINESMQFMFINMAMGSL